MSELQGVVGRLAGAIADGEPIEWRNTAALAADPAEQLQIEQLREIARLDSHARVGGIARGVADDRRFGSPLWTLMLLLAATQVVMAIASTITSGSINPGRFAPSQFAICSAFAAAALVLVWGGGRDSRATRLGHLYLLMAAAFAAPLIIATGLDKRVSILAFITRSIIVESFLPLALWQFGREFPRSARFTAFDRISPAVTRLMAVVGTALFVINLMLTRPPGSVLRDLARPFWLLRRANGGLWFWIIVLSLMLPVLAASLWRVRSSAPEERRRAKWFLSALVVGLMPVFAVVFLQGVSHDFNVLTLTGDRTARRVIDAVTLATILSIPLTTAYAVLAHRLLTLRVVVHRSIRYALAKYTLLGFIALPLVVPVAQMYRHRDRRIDEVFGEPGTLVSLGVMTVGVMLFTGRRRLLNLLDRVLIGESTDHASTLTPVLAAISGGRTPREVAFETARQIEQALGVSRVAVFVWDEERGVRTLHGVAPVLGPETAILALLAEKSAVSVNHDGRLFGLLPDTDREWLLRGRIETLVRIPMPHRDVGGLLGIGPRKHGIALTRGDFAFLNAVATTAGLALSRPWADGDGERASSAADDIGAVECTNCGLVTLLKECGCSEPPRPALVPRVLHGRFEMVRRLGRGGMGVVYLAKDLSLGRSVALKTLPQVSASAAAAMFEEAKSMAHVEHANLALIYDVAIWRDTPVLIVEYLAAGTLADALTNGPLDLAEALRMGAALADALAVLHDAGILHRDIKPSNVGFTRSRTPKLLDFGIARLLARSEVEPGSSSSDREDATSINTSLAGTPLYLPPEALSGARPDVLVDLWGLSLVVLEAILGTYPLGPRRQRAPLPPQVAGFFARALHTKREHRPQTAALMAAEMRAIAESTNVNVRVSGEGVHG